MLYTSFRLLTLKFKGWIIRRKYKVEIGKHQLARIAVAAVKEETEIEILQSDKFWFCTGGYDNDTERHEQQVKDYIASLK